MRFSTASVVAILSLASSSLARPAVDSTKSARQLPSQGHFGFNNGTTTHPFPSTTSGGAFIPVPDSEHQHEGGACTGSQHRCNAALTGWEVCSPSGQYIPGGDCASGTCQYVSGSSDPFCA